MICNSGYLGYTESRGRAQIGFRDSGCRKWVQDLCGLKFKSANMKTTYAARNHEPCYEAERFETDSNESLGWSSLGRPHFLRAYNSAPPQGRVPPRM